MLSGMWEKLKEAIFSVLPISAIVILLAVTITPLSGPTIALFLLCSAVLILGMALFTLGSEIAMTPLGEMVGAHTVQSGSMAFLIIAGFLMGTVITIAEPDLIVLAQQVPAFPAMPLILSIAAGVGVFLVVAFLRIVLKKPLNLLVIAFYAAVFALAAFTEADFLPVAFDSGGVTTGPITVPFILALGVGMSAVRGGKSAEEDSFGLVGLCSIGPIMAVLVLGMFFDPSASTYAPEVPVSVASYSEVLPTLLRALPHYFKEVIIALSPILAVYAIFQIFFLKLPARRLLRMVSGIVYTLVGLFLFLASVNAGFLAVGYRLGALLASMAHNWLMIPIAMVIGFFIVRAEPAVHVLNAQVEEITDGVISKRAMMTTLSLGIATSLGLAMVRILTRWSILWFVVPGYVLALAMSFFVPKVFTAIAIDSGGVASGPMTATFLLPLAIGAVNALGGNPMADAFGLVAMVAMTPLIAIQSLALVYALKTRRQEKARGASNSEEEIVDFD